MAQSIAIIGAGIAGLAAGCYARMNGFKATIYELHDKPGGLCTSWKRGGYTFDGCIHWLVGSSPGSGFNRMWRELGALPGPKIFDPEEFSRVEGDDGKALIVYTDEARLARHMKELSPADTPLIDEVADAIARLKRLDLPADTPGPLEALKAVPSLFRAIRPFRKFRGLTIGEFSEKFTDPFLRWSFNEILGVPEMPVMGLLMTLGWMSAKDAGYPEGGSLPFSRAIEYRFLELGGAISYRSRVTGINVENDRATGVTLEDGTVHLADIVISAADGHATIFEMLGGKYTDREIRTIYDEWPLWNPLVQVSIGVALDLSGEPRMVSFPIENPIDAGGVTADRLGYHHYCIDPTMAPAGKSAVVVYLEAEYDYWKKLSADRKAYDSEKERIGGEVVAALDTRFPGFKDGVEVVDVASPMTYVRYTENWRGSFEGWQITRENSRYLFRKMKRTLPGLANFYMVGQWLIPGGGLPTAAQSARDGVREICKSTGRKFTASEA